MTRVDDDAAERLRRRLYAPGATEDDVARYRDASTPVPHPPPVLLRRQRRRPFRAIGPMLPVVGILAVITAVPPSVDGPARARPAPTRSSVAVQPVVEPLRLSLRPVALPDGDSARVAELFTGSTPAADVAGDEFGALVMLRAAPRARAADLVRSGSGGSAGGGPARVALPDVAVEPGDLVVLSVVTRDPARVTWRFTTRGADERGGVTALVAASGRGRVAAAAARIAGAASIDGLVITASDSTPLRYRYALYRHRADSPFARDVSSVYLRCGSDRHTGEVRCVRDD